MSDEHPLPTKSGDSILSEQKNTEKTAQFAIQKLYTKDLSLEVPNSPDVFQSKWQPDVDVQLNSSCKKLHHDVYEVKLAITATAKLQDKVAFLVEVQQAGIFTIAQFPKKQRDHLLGSYCPNLIFPFARELIADLVLRAGFPPVYISPVNFDALYAQQHLSKQKSN